MTAARADPPRRAPRQAFPLTLDVLPGSLAVRVALHEAGGVAVRSYLTDGMAAHHQQEVLLSVSDRGDDPVVLDEQVLAFLPELFEQARGGAHVDAGTIVALPDEASWRPFVAMAFQRPAEEWAARKRVLRGVLLDEAQLEARIERALSSGRADLDTVSGCARFLADVRGEPGRARALYERAIALDPDSAPTLLEFANLLSERLGDDEAARPLFERAYAADPELAETSYSLFLARVGDRAGAQSIDALLGSIPADRLEPPREQAEPVGPRHNWVFTALELRGLAESDPQRLYAVLDGPGALDFLRRVWDRAAAKADPATVRPADQLGVSFARVHNHPVALVWLPPPEAPPDTYCIALVWTSGGLRYFGVEAAISVMDQRPIAMLCEWQGTQHANFGPLERVDEAAIIERLAAML